MPADTSPAPRQLDVLRAIAAHQNLHECAITIREIGEQLEISSTNGVSDHLKALRRKGLIEGVGRELKVTREGKRWLPGRAA